MSEHFTRVMSKKSDDELKQIAANYSDYSEDALSAVLDQIRSRNIESASTLEIENFLKIQEEKRTEHQEQFKFPTDLHPNIKLASNLLFASIPLGMLNFFLLSNMQLINGTKDVLIAVFSWVFMAAFGYWLRTGSKTSRTVVLIISIIGFIPALPFMIGLFQLNILTGIVSLCMNIISVYILVLLFKKESKEWYKSKRKEDNSH